MKQSALLGTAVAETKNLIFSEDKLFYFPEISSFVYTLWSAAKPQITHFSAELKLASGKQYSIEISYFILA